MQFDNRVAIVTGGAGGIGKTIAEEFRKAGAAVCIVDRKPNSYYVGDLADQHTLADFSRNSPMPCRWALQRRFTCLSSSFHILLPTPLSSIFHPPATV